MPGNICIHLDFAAVVDPNGAEEQVNQQHQHERQRRQEHQAGLQQFIERQMKDIKSDIDSIERIGNAKGRAIAKANEVVPLGVIAHAKQKSGEGARQCDIHHEEFGRELDPGSGDHVQFRPEAGRSRLTAHAVIRAGDRSLTQIDPKEQKRHDESEQEHSPARRQECPEDVDVVELSHPKPFFDIAGENGESHDEYYRGREQEPQGMSNDESPFGGGDRIAPGWACVCANRSRREHLSILPYADD